MALAYAALFAVSTALLFGVVYLVLDDYAAGQLRASVESEIAVLVEEASTKGLEHLGATLDRKIRSDQDIGRYLLLDAQEKRVVGDLPLSTATNEWSIFPDPSEEGEDAGETLVANGTPLPGGGFLVVAHEAHEQDELRQAIIMAFAWAGVLSVALALIGGIVMSRAFLRRIESFNMTAARIVDGRLGERIPISGSGDEFDRLAENLNDMLGRIQRLMESMRQVSSDVAHDLRTPLARLRQGLETARRRAVDRAMAGIG